MKLLFVTLATFGLLAGHAAGQGAQADQIKRRARDVSNQNNVRQGVPAPAQPAARPSSATAPPPAAAPATPQQQSIAKIQAHLAALKAGTPATAAQKQQLTADLAAACRGTKPSPSAVSAFVDDLTAALAEKTLEPARRARLAQDIEGALNSAAMPPAQFNAVVADVQAVLEVNGVKRTLALSAADKLKAVGLEVRGGAAR